MLTRDIYGSMRYILLTQNVKATPIIDKVVVTRSLALLRKEEGGKEHDRVLWTGQGVWVGVAVKIVSDEQERPTILGTARGLNIA